MARAERRLTFERPAERHGAAAAEAVETGGKAGVLVYEIGVDGGLRLGLDDEAEAEDMRGLPVDPRSQARHVATDARRAGGTDEGRGIEIAPECAVAGILDEALAEPEFQKFVRKLEGELRTEIAALEEQVEFEGGDSARYTLGLVLAPFDSASSNADPKWAPKMGKD